MNLIGEAWIPVRMRDGSKQIIAPWEIANTDVMFPDWPRADFNLACLELLIGFVYISDPPESDSDRKARKLDADRLRTAMGPLIPAFNLTGDGPLFLQDFDGFDGGSMNDPDMLFIDSAGASTIKKNQDVMVHGDRYHGLTMAEAAMALYTLQNFAPSGGAGNRTSMRGGGPLVTLLKPNDGCLGDIVWANVPTGKPMTVDELTLLPWMRSIPAVDNKADWPDPMAGTERYNPEIFFGQPRRIRLHFEDDRLKAVSQTPWGNNYVGWRHPLSPYYSVNSGLLPKHPKPGEINYSTWMGMIYDEGIDGKTELAPRVNDAQNEKVKGVKINSVLVGGWAMSNMSPQDFVFAEIPHFPLNDKNSLNDKKLRILRRLIESGTFVARSLAGTVGRSMGEEDSSAGYGIRAQTVFYQKTEPELISLIHRMMERNETSAVLCEVWLRKYLRPAALKIFQDIVMGRLLEVKGQQCKKIIVQSQYLRSMLFGYGKSGATLFEYLNLPQPDRKGKAA